MSKSKLPLGVAGSLLLVLAFIWFLKAGQNRTMALELTVLWSICVLAIALWWLIQVKQCAVSWLWVWVVAVILRILILWGDPVLSDDVYRYLWDGRVQLAGINPYQYAPSDARLDLARGQDFLNINHKEIPTIYPPAAQALFLVLAWLFPAVVTFKVAFALMDLALGLLLFRWCRARAPDALVVLVVLYLWHPLLLFEFASSGHVDIFWTLLFALAVWDLEQDRPWRATIWFAAAISTKLVAVAFLPLLWSRTSWRHVALGIVLAALTWLPYADAGWGLWSGLQAYSLFWNFNGFGFALINMLPGAGLWSRFLVPLLGLGGAVWIARRRASIWWQIAATLALLITLLPVNYPWYWPLLVVLVVWRPRLPWFLFSISLLLTYQVLPGYYAHNTWNLALWVRLVEGSLLLWGWYELYLNRDEPVGWRYPGSTPRAESALPRPSA
jgi:alpha-1,6-mannosyltransferase